MFSKINIHWNFNKDFSLKRIKKMNSGCCHDKDEAEASRCYLTLLVLFGRKSAGISTPWKMWWKRSETSPPGGAWPSCRTSCTLRNLIQSTSDTVSGRLNPKPLVKVWFNILVSVFSDRVLQEDRGLSESLSHRHQSPGSDLPAGAGERGLAAPEEGAGG